MFYVSQRNKLIFSAWLFAIIISSFTVKSIQAEEWEVKVEKSNLIISTRAMSGSEYLQVKATVVINAPLFKVKQMFSATGTCWDWQLNCAQSKIIKSDNPNKNTVHVILDLPWPLSDRDLVLDTKLTEQSEGQHLLLEMTPSNTQVKSKYVRAKSNIRYELIEQPDNQTQLNILMHTEMGGSAPVSLVNNALHKELTKDINTLLKLLE